MFGIVKVVTEELAIAIHKNSGMAGTDAVAGGRKQQ